MADQFKLNRSALKRLEKDIEKNLNECLERERKKLPDPDNPTEAQKRKMLRKCGVDPK